MTVRVMSRDGSGQPREVCVLSAQRGVLVTRGKADWLLEMPMLVDGGSREVTAESDPEAWLAALPQNIAGGYVWAEVAE